MSQITDIFEKIVSRFDSDKMAGMNAALQFDLTGDGGGNHTLMIDNGHASYKEGTADNPTATIIMDANDYIAMTSGELNPMAAFMQGKIKVKGDMATVMKLQSLLGG